LALSRLSLVAYQFMEQLNMLNTSFQIQIGWVSATVDYAGLALQAIRLYQFNVVVPNIQDTDAVAVTFSLSAVAGTQTLYTAVH
jgi:uncharacterized protein (TIGR03437 family)